MGSAVTIRGTRDGLLIALDSSPAETLLTELKTLLTRQQRFFRGGEVMIQFSEQVLDKSPVAQVLALLSEHGVSVRAILSQNVQGGETFQDQEQKPKQAEVVSLPPPLPDPEAEYGVFVQRTLRSGQSIRYPGHVAIIGDVNSGAEIVADGDIVVWGHLRGIVHAGAAGDEKRCIYALAFSPTQLRIGTRIARPPEQRRGRRAFGPERAFISDDQIIVETYS